MKDYFRNIQFNDEQKQASAEFKMALSFAMKQLDDSVPDSRMKDKCVSALEEAAMWGTKAIGRGMRPTRHKVENKPT